MSVLYKLRASMHVGSLDMKEKINIELNFTEKSFIIYFIEPLKEKNIEEIKDIFFPYISGDIRLVNMNYLYIKSIFLDGSNILKFTLYNPLSTSIFTLIFNHFKFKKKNILSKMNPSPSFMNYLVLEIQKMQQIQVQKNINNFINAIRIFYEFRSTERKYIAIINELFIKAFMFGTIYYNNSVKALNKSQEKIKSMPKDISYAINTSLNDIKAQIEASPDPQFAENNSSSFRENQENNNLEFLNDVNSELDIDSISEKDLFENYPDFAKFPSKIKSTTSYFTEVSINLIYKLFDVNHDDLNNKFNEINKTVNGRIINRKNLANLAQSEFNYAINNNNQISYFENGNIKNDYEDKINHWLEYCKEIQAFVPNNSFDNIISNTSQIIHRKFFEFFFKTFFSDIINIEIEKNKTLTSDEFHEILKILRRIKKILFTNKNLELYADFDFLNEEKNIF